MVQASRLQSGARDRIPLAQAEGQSAPRPAGSETSYVPGLDGVRAIAVAAVVGYHLEAPWLPGGLLGVGVFFTLSGYLYNDDLAHDMGSRGNLDLSHFWLRRARRLLPALIMVMMWSSSPHLLDNDVLPERGIEALAAVFYVSNWLTIASDVSYFQRFSGPGPLDHCGPWRWRSSSICCGRWCCFCLSRHCEQA